MICEEWRDILGFEGIYQVSSKGRLKSYKRDPGGKILKQTNRTGGYFTITLRAKDRPAKTTRLHRLVAEAFIPNPSALPEVNHLDGNKQNNAVENLEWCTRSHNVLHSIQMHPRQLDPMIHYNQEIRARSLLQITTDGRIVTRYRSSAEAASATGICSRHILHVAAGDGNGLGSHYKTAGGFCWRFESEVITA